VALTVRFTIVPDGDRLEYTGEDPFTYEEALLALGINPDIVLVRVDGRFVAQDEPAELGEAEVILTCSRG
jgi:sulfur carrier protein ThiS